MHTTNTTDTADTIDTTDEMQSYFSKLKFMYGSHTAAAKKLGISVGYYRGLRNGHYKITKRMGICIRYLANLIFT